MQLLALLLLYPTLPLQRSSMDAIPSGVHRQCCPSWLCLITNIVAISYHHMPSHTTALPTAFMLPEAGTEPTPTLSITGAGVWLYLGHIPGFILMPSPIGPTHTISSCPSSRAVTLCFFGVLGAWSDGAAATKWASWGAAPSKTNPWAAFGSNNTEPSGRQMLGVCDREA